VSAGREANKHWRRPLRDGGMQFRFVAGDRKASGSVWPAEVVDELQAMFEAVHHVQLPDPEMRPALGTWSHARPRGAS
jgi:hypothetical protein